MQTADLDIFDVLRSLPELSRIQISDFLGMQNLPADAGIELHKNLLILINQKKLAANLNP